jgi:hypothetical protein
MPSRAATDSTVAAPAPSKAGAGEYIVTPTVTGIGAGAAFSRTLRRLPPATRARVLPALRKTRQQEDPTRGWDARWGDSCLPLVAFRDGQTVAVIPAKIPEAGENVAAWIETQTNAAQGTAEENIAAAVQLIAEVEAGSDAAQEKLCHHVLAALALSGTLSIVRSAYVPWYYPGAVLFVPDQDDLLGVLVPIIQHPRPPDMNHRIFTQFADADDGADEE